MFLSFIKCLHDIYIYIWISINKSGKIYLGGEEMSNKELKVLLLILADLIEKCKNTAEAAKLIRAKANDL